MWNLDIRGILIGEQVASQRRGVLACSDLERIQRLFPSDSLGLQDMDAMTVRTKRLLRTKVRQQRRTHNANNTEVVSPSPEKRLFIMEAPVKFTTGVQCQDRHLFLFSDLLLVAKSRAGGHFKLKEKVRLSEMWLSRCCEEVAEVMFPQDTSMVIGWPTTNVIATFQTQAARDLWWSRLNEIVALERSKEPRSTTIQILFHDTTTNIEYRKAFSVTPNETVRCCVRMAVEQLGMCGWDASHFQLWAHTGRDDAPYPLIGHERPFAIKLNCLREGLSTEEGFDLDHCNNIYGPDPLTRCQFILRSAPKAANFLNEPKKFKKSLKSPMHIKTVFRRSTKSDVTDGTTTPSAAGHLFGLPLEQIYLPDGSLPASIMGMLQQLFSKGPFTQGIFRKCASARLVREARVRLDSGAPLETPPVLVTAALLKDFLRSLPDPLLTSNLYSSWLEAIQCESETQQLTTVRSLLEQLPPANHYLLSLIICVLHQVTRRAHRNLMTASNLGVCIGPALLWGPSACATASRTVPALAELLIVHCEALFGPDVTRLLGTPPDRQDSGAEESDSLHSGQMDVMPPRKDCMSLSRDSGLTLSDSQLYTPDEEESSSTSSGCNAPRQTEYTRAINPNFQRQDWFRQRSHLKRGLKQSSRSSSCSSSSSGSAGAGCGRLLRSVSEESLLSSYNPYLSKQVVTVHSKGQVPVPQSLARSKSAHHLCCDDEIPTVPTPPARKNTSETRSQSTPHIATPVMSLSANEVSYDSSTLSDDDSTPHVSRSNSRGKDCTPTGQWSDSKVVEVSWVTDPQDSWEVLHAAPVLVTPTPPQRKQRQSVDQNVKLRHLPPVHVKIDISDSSQQQKSSPEGSRRREVSKCRGRLLQKRAAFHRSKSLPPAQEEETCSPSQIQTLFAVTKPPPYRPPPIPSHRAPITAYHLGSSHAEAHVVRLLQNHRRLSSSSSSEQESYV